MTHVPYKGMSPAINDVAGGHIPMMFSRIPFALPLIQSGKLRMLGVTTTQRIEPIPEVPPLAEIGVPGFNASTWFMLVAPAKTPRAIVDKLHARAARLQQRSRRAGGTGAPGPDAGGVAAAGRVEGVRAVRDNALRQGRAAGGSRRLAVNEIRNK